MRYCFIFLVTHSTKWWLGCCAQIACSCVAHNMASISTFKSAFLSQFHVSFSSVVSSISLTNSPYILLFFHSSFCSLIQICLNSFLFTISIYSIVSPLINGSTEFLPNYFLIHPSQVVNPPPYISLLRYTWSTSLLGYSAPYIIITFLVLLSKLFNSSEFHFRILALYLITETTQVLTAIIFFLPFNFDLNISLNNCRRYCFLNFSLI